MKMVFLLVLSLFSTAVFADDEVIEYCEVNVKESFSINVNYGNVSDSLRVMQRKKPSTDKRFDDDVLYLTDKFNGSVIKLWANDEEDRDAIFYDSSIDEHDGVALRFDFVVTGHSGNKYIGDMIYYVEQAGAWVRKGTESLALSYTAHRARALYSHEIDEDNGDDLNGLHCSSGEPPVVNPPEFVLDICPYVPNTVQTNSIHQMSPGDPESIIPHGAMSINASGGNFVEVSNFKEEFFLSAAGINDCKFPDGTFGNCKITNELPVSNFPPALVWPSGNQGKDISCERGKDKNCNLKPGTYKDVTIKDGKTLVLQGGAYYFNELKFAEENVALKILGPTEIHYKKIMFEKSGVQVNAGANARPSEQLLIIGHGKDADFSPKDDADDIMINGYIYVEHLAESASNGFTFSAENNTLFGGVTANSIAISGKNNTIHATNDLNCFEPQTPKIARINIVPNNMYTEST
ncbi:hypothetical protein RJD38_08670 [Vibrio scophthalmi]|uniref:Uncharacterized protein n=1 Tax=Vibrio scophthalmi TaxID=45658 RepID=A0A1C7FDN8_9VIBR|nr:hypothetical protein [Vibrio scophthalmi]ANU37484.1 hypothetical protein VSVS05_02389 [Vibrio scophthalmi]